MGVPQAALTRVFLRSLVIQASWNRRGMQNLGFAYAMEPALRALYPDPDLLRRARERHLTTFNTHPYLAAAILGGAIHQEEKVARGEAPPESVERFKQALMGPFAAVGDSFFWLSLRPFTGALAAVAAPFVGLWVIPLFLLAYNVPHLWLRVRFFRQGVLGGERVVETVAGASLPRLGARLRTGVAALGGAAVVAAPQELQGLEGRLGGVWVWAGISALAFVAAYRVLGRMGPLLASWVALFVAGAALLVHAVIGG